MISRQWSYLILILIFMFVFPVNASTITTYSCCNSFETSNGTLLNNFDNISQWVVSGTGATLSNDTVNFREGNQSLLLSAIAPNTANIDWNITSTQLSSLDKFEIWIYFENRFNTSDVDIYFATSSAFTKYISVDFKQQSYTNISGWQKFSFSSVSGLNGLENYVNHGGMLSTDNVTRIRINNVAITGKTSNVSIDNFRYGANAKAKAIITFDDGVENIYTYAKNVLKSNNQKPTLFMITGMVGGNDGSQYLNLTELHDLENNYGWDISSHTVHHYSLTNNNTADIDSELSDSQQYLVSNGFSVKSSKLFAYPSGSYNQTVINETKKYYVLARTADYNLFQPQYMSSEYSISSFPYTWGWVSVNPTFTESKVTNQINDTINRSGIIFIAFHRIVANGTATLSTEYNQSGFMNISNYLYSRSAEIDVIPMSDMLIVTNTNFESVPDQYVSIFDQGSSIAFLVLIVMMLFMVVVLVKGASEGDDPRNVFIMVIVMVVLLIIILTVQTNVMSPSVNAVHGW